MKKKKSAKEFVKKYKRMEEIFSGLISKMKEILKKHPQIRGRYCFDVGEECFVVKLSIPYHEEVHGNRSFSVDSHIPKLNHLTENELDLFGEIASELAGGEFDVVLVPKGGTSEDGEFEYKFTPKK